MDLSEIEAELQKEFLQEAEELTAEIEDCFIEVEKNPSKTVLDKVFRLTHTIKGSGYAAGFDSLGDFAHVFESALESVRSGDHEITADTVSLFLSANDTLSKYVDLLIDDKQAALDVSEIVEKLNKFNHDRPPVARSSTQNDGLNLFSEDEKEEEQIQPSEAPLNEGAILVVDDEPLLLTILEGYLEELGMPVLTADNGLAALEVLKSNKVDLIVSDEKMPKMNGIEMMKEVRVLDPNIPVIFVSGAAEKHHVMKFLDLGAYGFIEKPVDEKQLLVLSRNALSTKAVRDTLMKLSALIFRSYVKCLQLSKIQKESDAKVRDKLQNECGRLLDEIATLTNRVLDQEIEHQYITAV